MTRKEEKWREVTEKEIARQTDNDTDRPTSNGRARDNNR